MTERDSQIEWPQSCSRIKFHVYGASVTKITAHVVVNLQIPELNY